MSGVTCSANTVLELVLLTFIEGRVPRECCEYQLATPPSVTVAAVVVVVLVDTNISGRGSVTQLPIIIV